MNADGSQLRQVTSLGGASFAPFFTPDGKKIIFSSNQHNPKGRDFELWLVNVDGSGLERVTWNASFDGFPMFSPDGKKLVFASNRFQQDRGRDQRVHRRLAVVITRIRRDSAENLSADDTDSTDSFWVSNASKSSPATLRPVADRPASACIGAFCE